jgi:putative DNA modification/repair radical SAM protein
VDALQKIRTLSQSAQYDLACACGGTGRVRGTDDRWIYPAVLPEGRSIFLLKVLLSNACANDCQYCVHRASHAFRRTAFSSEELAGSFVRLWESGRVGGLFLSSGVVGSADATMERMIKTVEILRLRHRFRGYVHLKILPGASYSLVVRSVQLATRVSVNLEAPSGDRLNQIATGKDFQQDLLLRMQWIQQIIAQQYAGTSKSQTTQFVVGAADESDREILDQTERMYRRMNLARVYYSAFQPIPGTPLEEHSATIPLREHRLYQADFLLRKYNFRFSDLIFDPQGNLPRGTDPKTLWARSHPELYPLEVNLAEEQELLRIPGIGPVSARKIVQGRMKNRYHNLEELREVGVWIRRAAPFILIDGRRAGSSQLDLFPHSIADIAEVNQFQENKRYADISRFCS